MRYTAILLVLLACPACDQDLEYPPDADDVGDGDLPPPDLLVDTSVADPGPADIAVDAPADTAVETRPTEEYCRIDDAHRYACCVLDEVNRYRMEQGMGLVDYTWDEDIAACGFYYAQYMASHGVFAHGADGQDFGARLDSFSVAWTSAGENLQRNALAGWEDGCLETVWGPGGWASSSAGHREAMLGMDSSSTPKGWTHAAAGVARGGGRWYVAMYFVRF
jgi:uncharacterized protein YkwD